MLADNLTVCKPRKSICPCLKHGDDVPSGDRTDRSSAIGRSGGDITFNVSTTIIAGALAAKIYDNFTLITIDLSDQAYIVFAALFIE